MRVIGMLRVKDEARWIERSIGSILPICDKVLVMDDHSSDGTPFLCACLPKVTVFDSPFSDLNECRDKGWLLAKAKEHAPDWIVMIDGDEMLSPGSSEKLMAAMLTTDCDSISMRIPYLWDREDQVRMDGVYGEYRRHSAFRPKNYAYEAWREGGFHCGNVPAGARAKALTIDAIQLLHFGYLHAADRARKYAWYNAHDVNNISEDRYRHIAAGLDVPHSELIERQIQIRRECGLPPLKAHELLPPPPAASECTMHGGPMILQPI